MSINQVDIWNTHETCSLDLRKFQNTHSYTDKHVMKDEKGKRKTLIKTRRRRRSVFTRESITREDAPNAQQEHDSKQQRPMEEQRGAKGQRDRGWGKDRENEAAGARGRFQGWKFELVHVEGLG